MARLVTFMAAAAQAIDAAKPGQSKDMLKYLLKTHGIDNAVDQNKLQEDLMRKQFTPYEEGGVLTTPTPSSLAKVYELHRPAWQKAGFLTVVNTEEPKEKKPPGKILQKIAAYEARITELEGALKEALAALEGYKGAEAIDKAA